MRWGQGLAASIAVAAQLLAPPVLADSAAEVMLAFGLLGTWSPDCNGPFRTSYEIFPGRAPTVRVTMLGREIATSEIQEAQHSAASQIKWHSLINTFALPDRPRESWMPEPGEIWET